MTYTSKLYRITQKRHHTANGKSLFRDVESMSDVRITVKRITVYRDLMEVYENPIEHACDMEEGMVFVSHDGHRPEGICDSAWETMEPFVSSLSRGEGDFFDGWMRDPLSAMVSCNDGFRPVSFYLETIR